MPRGRDPAAVHAQTLMGGLDCPVESLGGMVRFLAFITPFIVVPLWAWQMAWTGMYPAELEMVVIMGSSPALVVGVVSVVGLVVARWLDWRERRRVCEARWTALQDAPRVEAMRLPDLGDMATPRPSASA